MELGQKLATVIRDYRASHPTTSSQDVRLALRIAARSSGADAFRRIVLAGVLVALGFAGLLGFLVNSGPSRVRPGSVALPVVLLFLILGAVVLLAASRR